jgi:hypothetical protein
VIEMKMREDDVESHGAIQKGGVRREAPNTSASIEHQRVIAPAQKHARRLPTLARHPAATAQDQRVHAARILADAPSGPRHSHLVHKPLVLGRRLGRFAGAALHSA